LSTGGGSDWALDVVGWSLVALAPLVLIVGRMGEWVGMPVVLVVEYHGSLGFVVVGVSPRDGEGAMHVG
jgi:hypothetical protein